MLDFREPSLWKSAMRYAFFLLVTNCVELKRERRNERLLRKCLAIVLGKLPTPKSLNFPGGSEVKASACNAGAWVQSLGREDPLEKEVATHSSTLAWRIPWTEEPGGLQSTGSQRVRHD